MFTFLLYDFVLIGMLIFSFKQILGCVSILLRNTASGFCMVCFFGSRKMLPRSRIIAAYDKRVNLSGER